MRNFPKSLLFVLGLLGCPDTSQLESVIKEVKDADKKPGMQQLKAAGCKTAAQLPFVGRIMCHVDKASAISCAQAAKAYGEAVPNIKEFELAIIELAEQTVRCEGVFDKAGKKLREVKNKTTIKTRKTVTFGTLKEPAKNTDTSK